MPALDLPVAGQTHIAVQNNTAGTLPGFGMELDDVIRDNPRCLGTKRSFQLLLGHGRIGVPILETAM